MKYLLEIVGGLTSLIGAGWTILAFFGGWDGDRSALGFVLVAKVAVAAPGFAVFVAGMVLLGFAAVCERLDQANRTAGQTYALMRAMAEASAQVPSRSS